MTVAHLAGSIWGVRQEQTIGDCKETTARDGRSRISLTSLTVAYLLEIGEGQVQERPGEMDSLRIRVLAKASSLVGYAHKCNFSPNSVHPIRGSNKRLCL